MSFWVLKGLNTFIDEGPKNKFIDGILIIIL